MIHHFWHIQMTESLPVPAEFMTHGASASGLRGAWTFGVGSGTLRHQQAGERGGHREDQFAPEMSVAQVAGKIHLDDPHLIPIFVMTCVDSCVLFSGFQWGRYRDACAEL